MIAALVTAIGAVVVALVAVLGSRIEARDARNRLAKDVEIMLKLEPGTAARVTLEKHVAEGALSLAVAERLRIDDRRASFFFRSGVVYVAIAVALQTAVGGSKEIASIEYLRMLVQPTAWLFMLLAFIALILAAVASVIDHRRRQEQAQPAIDADRNPTDGHNASTNGG